MAPHTSVLLVLLTIGCAPSVGTGSWDDDDDAIGGGSGGGEGGGAGGGEDATVEDVPGTGDLSAVLFSDDELPHFELILDDDAWDELAAETESDRYHWVEATFIYEGVEYSPVGVRTKGENSWQNLTQKPSLKIQFDRFVDNVEFMGLSDLTLDAMNDDYSMMHERVAYLMYREAGLASARATHATLTINDENYGLYTNVETVDKRMMARWYEDDTGPLFEQHDVDWYDDYIPYFDLEYGEDDRTALQGVADAMENRDAAQAIAAAADYLNWEVFRQYWAVGAVVAQFDAYPYSSPGDDCHVFFNVQNGTLDYVPHGVDETFYYDDSSVVDNTRGIIGTTCLRDDDCRSQWEAQVMDAVDLAEAIDIVGYIDMVREQVAPIIEEDTHTDHPAKYIAYYQQLMHVMMENRRAEMERQLR